MTIVTSYIEAPGTGHPRVGVAVTVRILAVPSPWLADSTGQVLGTTTTWTGEDGWWRLEIKPFSEFELADYVYAEITERGVNPGAMITHYARVPPPPGGDPTRPVLLRDILVPPPTNQGPPPWIPIDRLDRLRDVDTESVRNAKPGDYLVKQSDGLWGAGRGPIPLGLYWEPHPTDMLTIRFRVNGFGGAGARVGFGDGSPEITVTTGDSHEHTYAGPGTYILTATDVAWPATTTKATVTVKDHAPRIHAFIDADDPWVALLWINEPADNTRYRVDWGDGSPVEDHAGQMLPRVPPHPRVPHQYNVQDAFPITVTDLATQRHSTVNYYVGKIGVLITYDQPERARIEALWLANGATWEMQRDNDPPLTGIVPPSGRLSQLEPASQPGDHQIAIREIVAGRVRRQTDRRRIHPTQWDWRMDVALTWRLTGDPVGRQTVTLTAKGARSRCTVEWGDGSAAGVVDPGVPISHLYTLPAPEAGWRLRVTETAIADPRTWSRLLAEPVEIGQPVLSARTNGAVDLDIKGVQALYNDDWYSIGWEPGSPPDPVGAVGSWYPANHVYTTPGRKTISIDGPGMAKPITRVVDVVMYPAPTVNAAEAKDADGKIIDPERKTARISVDNTASGGPCTVRLGDGSAPRACAETESFVHKYQTPGTYYIIATSNADTTAKGRTAVTVPFDAARTLFHEITGVPPDQETYTIKVKITAKTPGKVVEVQWDSDGAFEAMPPSDELTHPYEIADLYDVTVRYQDSSEKWTTLVDIPLQPAVM